MVFIRSTLPNPCSSSCGDWEPAELRASVQKTHSRIPQSFPADAWNRSCAVSFACKGANVSNDNIYEYWKLTSDGPTELSIMHNGSSLTFQVILCEWLCMPLSLVTHCYFKMFMDSFWINITYICLIVFIVIPAQWPAHLYHIICKLNSLTIDEFPTWGKWSCPVPTASSLWPWPSWCWHGWPCPFLGLLFQRDVVLSCDTPHLGLSPLGAEPCLRFIPSRGATILCKWVK